MRAVASGAVASHRGRGSQPAAGEESLQRGTRVPHASSTTPAPATAAASSAGMLLDWNTTRTPGRDASQRASGSAAVARGEKHVVAVQRVLRRRGAAPTRVDGRREERRGERRQPPHLHVGLAHRRHAAREVGLAAREVDRAVAAEELEHEARVTLAQVEEPFLHQQHGERLGGREAHRPHRPRFPRQRPRRRASEPPLPSARPAPAAAHPRARASAPSRVRRSTFAPSAASSPVMRRLAVERSRPASRAPRARLAARGDREEDADVVPVHAAFLHRCGARLPLSSAVGCVRVMRA